VQGNDGIVVVSVPDGSVCRCGEQMRAGERAGFDPVHEEVICLHCLADRRAGRPQVLERRQVRPAFAATPSPEVWVAAPPSGSRHRSGGPRPLTTGLVTAIVVVLALGVGLGALRSLRVFPRHVAVATDDPRAYTFMTKNSRGGPVTWDPCLTIELVVNSKYAPPGSDTLLPEAVERINAASGLHLKIVGPTTQVPVPAQSTRDLFRGLPGGARAPVLVAWTTPDVVPGLKGNVVGLGGPVHLYANSLDRDRYVGGSVDLDGPQMAGILQRPNGHAMARAVVMHELGHLVGLTHVANPTQVMAADGGTATEFAKGDLAGLAAIGSGGCPYDLTPDSPS
jgi:hypothetical protein